MRSQVTADSEPMVVPATVNHSSLEVIHDPDGQIVAIRWPDTLQEKPDRYLHKSISQLFGPVAIAPYLERVTQVLTNGEPQQFQCVVRCGPHPVGLDFNLSLAEWPDQPGQKYLKGQGSILTVANSARMPQQLSTMGIVADTPASAQAGLLANLSNYHGVLTNIASNIRKTLELKTIWQQTVDGLGNLLDLHRCLVCDYSVAMQTLNVVAEFHQPDLEPCLGKTFELANKSDFRCTINTLKPVLSDFEREDNNSGPYTVLTVATCYRDEPNSVLLLQMSPDRPWHPLEIDLVNELTDQVGTAIAHAKLFEASRTLADDLQRVNAKLIEKNDELEEARRYAEEASRLKSEFLANTSHELRTPLNGMIGFLRLVLDGMADDPEEQEEFIEEAHKSALHLLNLINDVLDIAKIEAGKMEIDLTGVSLHELFCDVENFTRPQAEQRGLYFTMKMPATLDEIKLYGNYQRILQVLLNLIGNAIKFTPEGGVTIRAEVKTQSVRFQNRVWPGHIKISVEDTGIGVSLEKQNRLFQTFSQVDGERTRQYGGTGLGLAISQRLIEAMGGKVQFISMGEGLGSTVTFTIVLYQEPVIMAEVEGKQTA
ncbi:ATP-binding protein [Leptothoe sp. PORK10 BA2]|uniref:ATP-binding protein n=1 Tax=Leptothoe sp. PORK10 BA2 TaxID=3110254 RepID=UPI002B1F73EB|nr:ATP-binding protein [Leptothoe sp. PORK10 BA2]MEA5462139.1 ATP-binding protein [Leptothoe sp. PORK10 BA2]